MEGVVDGVTVMYDLRATSRSVCSYSITIQYTMYNILVHGRYWRETVDDIIFAHHDYVEDLVSRVTVFFIQTLHVIILKVEFIAKVINYVTTFLSDAT